MKNFALLWLAILSTVVVAEWPVWSLIVVAGVMFVKVAFWLATRPLPEDYPHNA